MIKFILSSKERIIGFCEVREKHRWRLVCLSILKTVSLRVLSNLNSEHCELETLILKAYTDKLNKPVKRSQEMRPSMLRTNRLECTFVDRVWVTKSAEKHWYLMCQKLE